MNSLIELQYIKGVGPTRAEALMSAGFKSIYDLIKYYPKSYIDRKLIPNIKSLKKSILTQVDFFEQTDLCDIPISQDVSIIAKIVSKKINTFTRKSMTKIVVSDGTDNCHINFWSNAKWFYKLYFEGEILLISGIPEIDKNNILVFTHPEIEKIDQEDENLFNKGFILPKYKVSEQLSKSKISQKILRKIIKNCFDHYIIEIKDTLPQELLEQNNLLTLENATYNLHFPEDRSILELAQYRMKFEEIFYYLFNIVLTRQNIIENRDSIVITQKSNLSRKLYNSLTFELTKDQKKVLREIDSDYKSNKPMNRLIQGDVGSGKTIVSVFAMLMVLDAGFQCLMMAPTEILAEQHFQNISNLLKNLDIDIYLLTGSVRKKLRDEIFNKILTGKPCIIIGTHALFQSEIKYKNLALVVIDEQHRFGVEQRAELIKMAGNSFENKSIAAHILILSATPIPRTLSLTAYGDLDISVIKTMPKNRKPIISRIFFESQRENVYKFIRKEISLGRQCFIVYPLVEKSDKLELKSAIENYELLSNEVFFGLKLGLLHGQMLWDEKEKIMKSFLNKEFDILVATTVIEVGIDIPNASVILIEDAQQFGLAQLHQLRGRVGRSDLQSYCFLMTKDQYKYTTSEEISQRNTTIHRLKTIERTNDGFEISEVDLKLRGPGDIVGKKQSGLPEFHFLDIVNDYELIVKVKQVIDDILNEDNNLSLYKNKIILNELKKRYGSSVSFYNIA